MSTREVRALAFVLATMTILFIGFGLMTSVGDPPPEVRQVLTACLGYDIGIISDGDPLLLTHDESSYDPSLSPDGRSIVFMRGDPATNTSQGWTRSQWWVMSANGQSARPLTEMTDSSPIGSLVWSPDSRSLMYRHGDALMGIDIATGARTVLVDGVEAWPGASFSPSPDGSHIVAAGPTIIDLSDGSSQRLAEEEFTWTHGVIWSPDGEWLVMEARSLAIEDPEGGIWAYHLGDESSWRISENRNATYQWTGDDQLLNVRDGEGASQTAYLTDLSERQSTPVDVPETPTFPDELDACAR